MSTFERTVMALVVTVFIVGAVSAGIMIGKMRYDMCINAGYSGTACFFLSVAR